MPILCLLLSCSYIFPRRANRNASRQTWVNVLWGDGFRWILCFLKKSGNFNWTKMSPSFLFLLWHTEPKMWMEFLEIFQNSRFRKHFISYLTTWCLGLYLNMLLLLVHFAWYRIGTTSKSLYSIPPSSTPLPSVFRYCFRVINTRNGISSFIPTNWFPLLHINLCFYIILGLVK